MPLLDCNTRYYPDYYVHTNATKRTYYTTGSITNTEYIQISMHYFMSRHLAELFTSMMVNAWYVLVIVSEL